MKTTIGVHPDVLRLGFVSLLTDVSSEMIFSVFAIFFTTIAGASSALLGLIEGLADFSASSSAWARVSAVRPATPGLRQSPRAKFEVIRSACTRRSTRLVPFSDHWLLTNCSPGSAQRRRRFGSCFGSRLFRQF